MTIPPASGLVNISGSVDTTTREILRAAGDGNISAGLRLALELPTRTLSGARWIAHPALLPDPQTADGPEVLAMPGGIVAHGVGPAGLIVDAENDRLLITGINHNIPIVDRAHELATELTLRTLATLAARILPAVLAACANEQQADQFGQSIGAGLLLRRLSHGLIEIAAQGQPGATVVLPVRQALQFAAELSALLSRRVAQHQEQIADLNAAAARVEAAA